MSKRSNEAQRQALLPAKEKRNLSPEELIVFNEMRRAADMREYEAGQVHANTALVPHGKQVAEQLAAIAQLLRNAQQAYLSSKLLECGYSMQEKVSINLTTGVIFPYEPGTDPKPEEKPGL
jgi:hypothetical protein